MQNGNLPFLTQPGWTCFECGTWVPIGTTHYCSTKPSGTAIQTNPIIYKDDTKLSIEEALDLLEKEITWCKSNTTDNGDIWKDGYIKGLEQAIRLLKAGQKAISGTNPAR